MSSVGKRWALTITDQHREVIRSMDSYRSRDVRRHLIERFKLTDAEALGLIVQYTREFTQTDRDRNKNRAAHYLAIKKLKKAKAEAANSSLKKIDEERKMLKKVKALEAQRKKEEVMSARQKREEEERRFAALAGNLALTPEQERERLSLRDL